MPVGVFDLINLVRAVYQVCQDVSSSRKIVRVAGDKLLTMVPLLEQLQAKRSTKVDVPQGMVEGLQSDLQKLEKVIKSAQQMNWMVYVLKASSIHDDIVSIMDQMQFSLGALGVQQNASLHEQLQEFQDQWKEDMKDFKYLREDERKQRQALLKSDSQSLIQMSDGNLEEAYQAMQAEQEKLREVLKASNDSVRRSKLEQEEAYIQQIIAVLEVAEAQSANTFVPAAAKEAEEETLPDEEFPPKWSICPVTHEVMTDPVIVDAPCHHTFSREAIAEWISRDHRTCPVCSSLLRSSIISPLPQLRDAIENNVLNKMNPQDPKRPASVPSPHHKEAMHHKSDPPAVSSAFDPVNANLDVDIEVQAPNVPTASEQSEKEDNDSPSVSTSTDHEDQCLPPTKPVSITQLVLPLYACPGSTKEEKKTTKDALVEEDRNDAPSKVGEAGTAAAGSEGGPKRKRWIRIVVAVAAVIIGIVVAVVLTRSETTTWNDILSDPTRTEIYYSPAPASLVGTLPTELGLLTRLTDLSIYYSDLSGTIPTELGLLTELQQLVLEYNLLSGTIPKELGLMTKLTTLSLIDNQLTGTIPIELGLMTKLTQLTLGRNKLSGTIPTKLGLLTELQWLSLYNNQLSGTIPFLPNITFTNFEYNNLT